MPFADTRNVRRGGAAAGTSFFVQENELNESLLAQGLPERTESSRKGGGWSSMAVAAVAALVVRPSTTAAFEIWNGNAQGGKSLVIDDIFTFNLVSSAIQGTFSVWAQVNVIKAAPAAGANVTINGNTGKPYGGAVVCGLSTTVLANGWRPYGTSPAFGLGTATPGGCVVAPINGKLIVPPGCSLSLHTVAQTTAWTFQNGASWFEEQITNE